MSLLLIQFPGSLLPFQLPPISVSTKPILHFLGFSYSNKLSRYYVLVSVIYCSMACHLKKYLFLFLLMILWARNLVRDEWQPGISVLSAASWDRLTQARCSKVLSLSVWGYDAGCLLGTLVLILVLSPLVVTLASGPVSYTWFPFTAGLSWSTWQFRVTRKQVETYRPLNI